MEAGTEFNVGQLADNFRFVHHPSITPVFRYSIDERLQKRCYVIRKTIFALGHFAFRGEGKDNFGKWPEMASVFHSPGDLLHTEFFVTVNSTKPEREPRTAAL